MFFPSRNALEQSTPEAVAFYRAARLSCDSIADLCCGIGMDSIALAKYCKKVIAMDVDEKTLECAVKNAEVYGIKNIEFIQCEDSLKIDLGELGVNAVFADPSRRKNNERFKAFSETRPRTDLLLKKIAKSGIEDYCIEISRDFEWQSISLDCEKEFISLNNELNSISLHFGKFQKCNKSAVVLPSNLRIESNAKKPMHFQKSFPEKFLMELDNCIVFSKMHAELLGLLPQCRAFSDSFFTSSELVQSPFFKNVFEILAVSSNLFSEIIPLLKKFDCKTVVLRGSFSEEKTLMVKTELEKLLSGFQKLHVFFFENRALICKNAVF